MIPPIENMAAQGEDAFRDFLRGLDDGCLLGQELCQKGAMHAIRFLLDQRAGKIYSTAKAMEADLARCAMMISEECASRGLPIIQE